jgi:hypothetical protein
MSPTDVDTIASFLGPPGKVDQKQQQVDERQVLPLPPEMAPAKEEPRPGEFQDVKKGCDYQYWRDRFRRVARPEVVKAACNLAVAEGKLGRGLYLAMSSARCTHCSGAGARIKYRSNGVQRVVPCKCVYLRVFRACLNKWREIQFHIISVARRSDLERLEFHRVQGARVMYGLKKVEYLADFELVSRRMLSEEEHRLFRLHFLQGQNWKVCSRVLCMDRGTFFHAVYRIEQKLGRTYLTLKPYALYPIDEYFYRIRRDAKEV